MCSAFTKDAGHTRQRKQQQKRNKKLTQYALYTTIHKQTQITLIRHEPSYKQLVVKTNRTSFCMWKKQHGTQNVKTNNRRTQKTKMMSNTDLNDR
jgi:hypothetical protein